MQHILSACERFQELWGRLAVSYDLSTALGDSVEAEEGVVVFMKEASLFHRLYFFMGCCLLWSFANFVLF